MHAGEICHAAQHSVIPALDAGIHQYEIARSSRAITQAVEFEATRRDSVSSTE